MFGVASSNRSAGGTSTTAVGGDFTVDFIFGGVGADTTVDETVLNVICIASLISHGPASE